MKLIRQLSGPICILSLLALACGSLPNFTIPSLATATARAALTATVEGGGDYQLSSGLVVGSAATREKAIDDKAPLLENLATETYQSAELSQAGHTYTFTITLDKEQTLLWQTNWCTTTEDTLKQNLDHIQLQFKADGELIDPGHIGTYQTRNDDLYCAYAIVALSNWPKGDTVLTIDVDFTESINDGLSDYPKGTHTYKYTVTLK
jgi:hypothetical protein